MSWNSFSSPEKTTQSRSPLKVSSRSPQDWKDTLRTNCLAAARRSRQVLSQKARRQFAARLIDVQLNQSPPRDWGSRGIADDDPPAPSSASASLLCDDDDDGHDDADAQHGRSPRLKPSSSSPFAVRSILDMRTPSPRRSHGRRWDDSGDADFGLTGEEYLDLLLRIEDELRQESEVMAARAQWEEEDVYYQQLDDEEQEIISQLSTLGKSAEEALLCPVCHSGSVILDHSRLSLIHI